MKGFISILLCIILFCTVACSCSVIGNYGSESSVNSADSDAQEQNNSDSAVSAEDKVSAYNDALAVIENGVLQYPASNDEYEYNVYDTYIEITEYIGDDTKITIPSTIDGLPVLVVGDNSGKVIDVSDIKSVKISEGIAVIGNDAFAGYAWDKAEFELPGTIVTIGDRAFYYSWDGDIDLPNSVTSIGEEAFYGLSGSVTEIVIPSGVESIGYHSFMSRSGYYAQDSALGHAEEIDIKIYSTDLKYDGQVFDSDFILCGYAGSTTAEYCAEHGNTFNLIDS